MGDDRTEIHGTALERIQQHHRLIHALRREKWDIAKIIIVAVAVSFLMPFLHLDYRDPNMKYDYFFGLIVYGCSSIVITAIICYRKLWRINYEIDALRFDIARLKSEH